MTDWLKRAKKEGTPLIDGNQATFVWKGKKAPSLHLESHSFEAVEMEKVAKNVWIYQAEFPLDAYVEYNYSKETKKGRRIVKDRFNDNLFDTGVGHDNHYFSMPERPKNRLIKRKKGIKRGKVTKLVLKNLGLLSKRKLWLYQPVSDEPVPLLLVYDGKDYKQRGKIVQIVDNLIAEKKIRPIAMAMIASDFRPDVRFVEYNQGETTLSLFGRYILPLAQKHLNLLDINEHQGAFGVMGASMGGLMAVYTSLRLPHIFGHAISQSGAVWGKVFEGESSLLNYLVETMPVAPIQVWLDVGIFEFLLDDNREFHQHLSGKGYDVHYHEYSGGHNYTCWRDSLPEALITMFGA